MMLPVVKILILIMMLGPGCASLADAGRAYFRQGMKTVGVEPAEVFIARMNNDKQLREISYGRITAQEIVKCSILRNQLYVAAGKWPNKSEIAEAIKVMEPAYQDNDDAFLEACDKIIATPIGKTFLSVQQEYLIERRQE